MSVTLGTQLSEQVSISRPMPDSPATYKGKTVWVIKELTNKQVQ